MLFVPILALFLLAVRGEEDAEGAEFKSLSRAEKLAKLADELSRDFAKELNFQEDLSMQKEERKTFDLFEKFDKYDKYHDKHDKYGSADVSEILYNIMNKKPALLYEIMKQPVSHFKPSGSGYRSSSSSESKEYRPPKKPSHYKPSGSGYDSSSSSEFEEYRPPKKPSHYKPSGSGYGSSSSSEFEEYRPPKKPSHHKPQRPTRYSSEDSSSSSDGSSDWSREEKPALMQALVNKLHYILGLKQDMFDGLMAAHADKPGHKKPGKRPKQDTDTLVDETENINS